LSVLKAFIAVKRN